MVKHVVRISDVSLIRKLAKKDWTAQAIATQLGINLDRVEDFMPKDEKIEKAEKEVKAAARAKRKEIDDDQPLTKAANTRKGKKGGKK